MLNFLAVRFGPSLQLCPPKTKMKLLSLYFRWCETSLAFQKYAFHLKKEIHLQKFEGS